jgi:drug/metabolite transporter (DMT)-like permease
MYRVILAYAGMCLIWGTTWLGIKVGLHTLGPITGVGLRFLIAGLLLYVVAAWRGRAHLVRDVPWVVVAVLAWFLFGLDYLLTYTAETHLDSGLVSVLFATLPFFAFAFGRLMIGERTTPLVWMGALLSFVGVGVISLTEQVRASPLFALCAVGAAAAAAFGNVYAKRHSHYDPLVTLPPSMVLAGAVLTCGGLAFEHTDWHAALSVRSLLALGYLAIFGSCIAFFLMMWVLQRVPAWVVGMSTLIFPVIAVTVGVLFGGEQATYRELLGAALVIVGLAIALARTPATATVSES